MALQVGHEVGPYTIIAHVGAGGMGEVYRARDRKLDRDVALKVLRTETASAEHLRRFEQEARAASALNHPNIISIYDIGRADSIAYIAMELVEGRDLRELMDSTSLSLKQVLRIACKIADGLAVAHGRGITHRDLKPENVMISKEGFVKILDFGLAKLLVEFSTTETTQPHTLRGTIMGTVAYMSPEQAAGKPVDFRSDQFSFGSMLYELLAGRKPFEAPSAAETMTEIIREDPPPVTNYNATVPQELIRILDRCFSKSPDDRYASTRDLARDLREVRDSLTHGSQPGRDSGELLPPSDRRWIPLALSALAAVVVAAWVITSRVTAVRAPEPAPIASSTSVRSIAVLPFRNTGGSDSQLFTDGISETISLRLAQSRLLRVVGPFDGVPAPPSTDPGAFARRRGAELALTGSVQRAGEQLRVNWKIVDAASGQTVATETSAAHLSELFVLQDRVGDGVLAVLRIPAIESSMRPSFLQRADDQQAYLEAVGLLQRSKDEKSVDQAIGKLETLLANARDAALVNGLLGRALYYKAQLARRPALIEQAIVYAERAADLDASLADVHVTLGLIRNATGRHAEAGVAFQRALALRPDMNEALVGMAETMERLGRAADAEHHYQRALALNPDSPSVSLKYGSFCYARGRYDDAAKHFTKVTQLMPDSPRGHANLGAAHHALGKYDLALAAYQKSLEIEPTSATYSNVGALHFSLGRYAEAAVAFEKAVERAPNDYLLWANLADAYRWAPGLREKSSPAYSRAVSEGREALSINARDALAYAILASCHAKRGELVEAQTTINTALKLDPINPNVLYHAAVVAHLRGNDDAAETWLKRALSVGYSAADAKRDPELAAFRATIMTGQP